MIIPVSLASLAFVLLLLALWVLFAQPGRAINRWFAAYTCAISGWALSIAILHSGFATEVSSRLAFVTTSFIPPFFLAFTRAFPTPSSWPSPRILRVVLSIALVFAVLALTTPLLINSATLTTEGFTRKSGALYPFFAAYFPLTWIAAFSVFIGKWRHARGQAKAQLRYLGIGLLVSFGGGLATNLLAPVLFGRTGYTWAGPYFTIPMVVLVGHAIIRHRLLDLRLIVHRGATFASLVTVLALLSLYFINLVRPFSLTSVASVPLVPLVLLLITLIIMSAPVAPAVIAVVDRYFFKGRLDRDRILVSATRRLQGIVDPAELSAELQRLLMDTLTPESMAILMKANNRRGWICLTGDQSLFPSRDAHHLWDHAWNFDGPLPGVLLLDAIGERNQRDDALVVAETLRSAGCEIWIGLGRPLNKHGVILLGARRSGEAYLASDFDFLEALAEIATIATEIMDLHRRQLTLERERQRDAHLARMAKLYAGLAHEIRTPLTTLSNLISMLPDRLADSDYRELLVTLVPQEVSRISALADKLRALAPSSAPPVPVALQGILQSVVTLQQSGSPGKHVRIDLEIDPSLPAIMGDQSRLIQLFTNLVQNAVDASPPDGRVLVEAIEDHAQLTVQILDEGTGISSEVQERMFEPFLTTKSTGMGLGLSICREIAEAHRARLILENRDGHHGAKAEVIFYTVAPITDGHLRAL